MDNLNNASLTSYLNGLDAAGWQAFSSDLQITGILNAFQSRFILTSRWVSALSQMNAQIQTQFANVAAATASAVQSGALVSTYGVAFDANPTGTPTVEDPIHGTGTFSVSVDPKTGKITVDPTITITINF
jgi:hypothetical protein